MAFPLHLLHAQTATVGSFNDNIAPVQSAQADSVVSAVAEDQGLPLLTPDQVPFYGTFWTVLPGPVGAIAPFPCPPLDPSVPVYAIADGQFLVDETGGQVPVMTRRVRLQAQATGNTVVSVVAAEADAVANLIAQIQTTAVNQQMGTMARAMGMDVSSPMFISTYAIDPNGLWLEITNVSGGLAYLNLYNATDQVYAVWSTTNLTTPLAGWQMETELWPAPDQTNVLPFTVANSDRPILFLRAEDWTGVDSDGDGLPDWWEWKYFGTYSLNGTDLDANGNTLLYDYSNGIAPNDADRVPILLSTLNVSDPVDIKFVAPGNLYVLSRSTATLTEFDADGNVIRFISDLGVSPTGFDVDANGNVYVVVTSSNQVWKFNPTPLFMPDFAFGGDEAGDSFVVDQTFGSGGFIGLADGTSGTNNAEFNVPYDVAISPDGGTISLSDSGNNRIQQFTAKGTFTAVFGSAGGDVGQFNAPKGLTYDSIGNLYIADSGNKRIILAHDSEVLGAVGRAERRLGDSTRRPT